MDNFWVIAPLSNYEWYWFVQISLFGICCPLLLLLLIIHSYNVISDICTSNRSSIKSLTNKPQLNSLYLSMTLITITSIILFTYSSCICLLWMWRYNHSNSLTPQIQISITIGSIAWLLAKQSMYILFLFRLYATYKGSLYEYNYKLLIIIGIISCISTIICILAVIFLLNIKLLTYPHIPFAAHYDTSYPFWAVIMTGSMDIGLSILFIYLFMRPLIIIASQMCCNNKSQIDAVLELYAIGTKSLILTSMSIFTTLCLLLSVLLTNTLILLPVDAVINCICMMMIAPYYPDKKYYEKCCYLPIKCSEKWELRRIEMKIEISQVMHVPNNTPNGSRNTSPTETNESDIIVEF